VALRFVGIDPGFIMLLGLQFCLQMKNQAWRWIRDTRVSVRYFLAEQPMVAHFRWDHHAWGSTWLFPLVAIASYLLLILLLKVLLIPRKRPLPLGPIPAIHNLCVIVASAAIFVGCWEATAVEIRETRWIRSRKFKNAAEWIMCFPQGTRPSGRVFFWSYIFYLTKYHQLFDTVIWILRKKPLTFLHVFHHIAVVCVCYAWLEFSQSLQIVTILASTLLYVVVYSYFLCRSIGWGYWSSLRPANCQIVHLAFTLLAYVALVALHFTTREGCNGMGALFFDALSTATLLLLFLNFYLKQRCSNTKSMGTQHEVIPNQSKKQL